MSLVEKICAVAKKFSQSTYSTFEALDEHRLEFVSLMEMLGYEDQNEFKKPIFCCRNQDWIN